MGVEARPKEGAGGLTVTQVPRPRGRQTAYLHPGESEQGGDWHFQGMGVGPIWELVCEPHQVSAHNPTVMHSWGLDEAGGGGGSLSPVIHRGYWGENRRQHP